MITLKTSVLSDLRKSETPNLAELENLAQMKITENKQAELWVQEDAEAAFPQFLQQKNIQFSFQEGETLDFSQALRVGVTLSGGQAPGGHNVIIGLLKALKKLNPKSTLWGFLDGPGGICKGQSIEITPTLAADYLNQGGFDMIGSGRTKIKSEKQMQEALDAVVELNLDSLIVIGGDDSNTNAFFLAKYFQEKQIKTKVFGVPKTIDGDLKNEEIAQSFGFDTASKIYSELIGNLMKDALSAKKYYHFVRLMGRNASHITLECALQTQPNAALIGEEVFQQNASLNEIVDFLENIVTKRAEVGKHYGVFLIPEGLIEFVPEVRALVEELNDLMGLHEASLAHLSLEQRKQSITDKLSDESKLCYECLPSQIQEQLLMDRDPHGNVQVSRIETEKLLAQMLQERMDKKGEIPFSTLCHFFGYEGRSGLPSLFDSHYTYALGYAAALLSHSSLNAYITVVKNLHLSHDQWQLGACPLLAMMHKEKRKGKEEYVINKALVDLNGPVFTHFFYLRKNWQVTDHYQCSGPIQFYGSQELTFSTTHTLQLNIKDNEV